MKCCLVGHLLDETARSGWKEFNGQTRQVAMAVAC